MKEIFLNRKTEVVGASNISLYSILTSENSVSGLWSDLCADTAPPSFHALTTVLCTKMSFLPLLHFDLCCFSAPLPRVQIKFRKLLNFNFFILSVFLIYQR